MKLQEIISAVQSYHPNPDLDSIHRAFAFVQEHHKGQTRASGEPFVTHVSEVSLLATKLKLDVPSIATALLHDVVEDTNVSLDMIRTNFGADVAQLVDGVTKLSKVNFSSRAEEQAENFRKMLLAMSKDIRVLLVKLCDRTHNMRTLEFLSESRRTRIAQETLDIYAPLAHRLGIHWMKSELEDLSFRFLKPQIYLDIKERIAAKKKERERYIQDVCNLLSAELEQNSIKGEVAGRPKHFYSIYRKMETQGLHFDEIYDLIAFRIIVPTTMDCYAAIGVVHAAWKPIPGRFKDYIAMPKSNDYQSLHTTVVGPQARRIEIQIRTPAMHEVAEKGVAAHWIYKEGKGGMAELSFSGSQFNWLKELVESERMLGDPHEFMSIVKEDLFPQDVFVFSPKGDVIALAAGSTPIDFAYHIHSEVGHHCAGARVNGQQVPLDYKLQNGDAVEISTSTNRHPTKDWLAIVATSRAKQKIRGWLKSEERARSITVGKELLIKDLRRVKLNFTTLMKDGSIPKIAEEFGLRDVDLLLAEIGYGKITPNQIVRKLLPDDKTIEDKLSTNETAISRIFKKAAKVFRDRAGIKISGLDDVVFKYANCCEPLPGDEIVGYVTRGRGVTVHARSCAQTMSFDARRLIPVAWDDSIKSSRIVRLRILCLDTIGMAAKMTQAISDGGASIKAAQIISRTDGKAIGTFEIDVQTADQVDKITRLLENIDGVLRVERFRKRGRPEHEKQNRKEHKQAEKQQFDDE